jgi:hypothetical protein
MLIQLLVLIQLPQTIVSRRMHKQPGQSLKAAMMTTTILGFEIVSLRPTLLMRPVNAFSIRRNQYTRPSMTTLH